MLLTSRTPLRISFFGGGTDYPEYFQRGRGAVLGMAIDKYIYISTLKLKAPINYNYRLSYSKLELVSQISEIQHPVVREVLKVFEITEALDINIITDLPASSGLGSSSSFTVGFINSMAAMKGLKLTKFDLAQTAIRVEREILKERVGVQDQLHASYGGINRFDFEANRFKISPMQLTSACQNLLASSMMLVFTGKTRWASETLDEQLSATVEKKIDLQLENLLTLVDQATTILESGNSDTLLSELGALLDESWKIKKGLSSKISNSEINELYDFAKKKGALGGKLCGAGGGGFLLLLVPTQNQEALAQALSPRRLIQVSMDTQGSVVLYS